MVSKVGTVAVRFVAQATLILSAVSGHVTLQKPSIYEVFATYITLKLRNKYTEQGQFSLCKANTVVSDLQKL